MDLNLLPVLAALFEAKSVSRAASLLNLTQPAVSRALQRLRAHFKDPLFVRGQRGLTPTARALAIQPVLVEMLGTLNLQDATRVAANDKDGRERLCRYILRPPLANDRRKVLGNGEVRLDFKRPWSDGTSSIEPAPVALIARLAALVPTPRRHTVLYCGVLSSHAASRKDVVPTPATTVVGQDKPKSKSKYLRWSDLLRRVFGIETVCRKCHVPLRLISLIKSEAIATKILTAMHLVPSGPRACPPSPCPTRLRLARRMPTRPSFAHLALRPDKTGMRGRRRTTSTDGATKAGQRGPGEAGAKPCLR